MKISVIKNRSTKNSDKYKRQRIFCVNLLQIPKSIYFGNLKLKHISTKAQKCGILNVWREILNVWCKFFLSLAYNFYDLV